MSLEPAAKMWSGRFREPLNATFESWQRSFPFDWRLLPQEIDASIAHARMIEAAGILTSDELSRMIKGLRTIAARRFDESIVAANPQAEDIHHYVELELTKEIGDLALKLHTGRSRNEQIATDMRLFVRGAIDSTLDGLRSWREALVAVATAAGDAVMPSYTAC
jgi:argininosuccinate lyase